MAKERGDTVADDRTIVVSVKGPAAYRDWVNELAYHCRLRAADVVELALSRFAVAEGFKRPAPRRKKER